MKKIAMRFAIMFALILTPAYGFCETEVKEMVNKIQNAYNGITDIQGSFVQESYITDLDERHQFQGKFFIKMPSLLRWNYQEPKNEEVIIKDNTLWIYKKSEKQVIKTAFDAKTYGQAPIALLTGLGNIDRDFIVSKGKKGMLSLLPKSPMGAIKAILIGYSNYQFPISNLKLIDIYGNEISIFLQDVKINQGIKSQQFDFTPPKGIEIFTY
jgi:outer membrane lipoprotein carrier protein